MEPLDYRIPTEEPSRYSPALHTMALITAAVTFPLIFMGGLVTTKGAGLSVPDWPNSFGYNMFLFPPSRWVGGIFFEHTHRLLGTLVGFLSIILTVYAWRSNARIWVKLLASGVLGMVIFQGILGGLRVVLVNLDLAIVHACVAQAFLCLAASVAVVSSRWWIETEGAAPLPTPSGRNLIKLAILTASVIYMQLVIGAVMRHNHAGLAIPEVKDVFGHALPPTDQAGLDAANAHLAQLVDHSRTSGFERDSGLPTDVSFFMVWIAFLHRVGAIVVSTFVLLLAGSVVVKHKDHKALFQPALLLFVLLFTQVTLGVLVVVWRKPADLTSFHVAVGALLLVTCVVLAIRAGRLYSSAFRGARPVTPTAGSDYSGQLTAV